MAVKSLQVELLEKNLFVELDAEETMAFSTIIAKLRTENHLKPEQAYFVKTTSGIPVMESSPVCKFRQKNFVITENADWKSPEVKSGNLTDVPEVSDELVLNDNMYWILPFCSGLSWDHDEIQTQLFNLNNVVDCTGKKLVIHTAVQYMLTDGTLSGNKHSQERASKMRQILEDAFNVELAVNTVSENNFYSFQEQLTGKMHYYLTSYMESKWGTKIEKVALIGFREYQDV